jgi:hypothetical protein
LARLHELEGDADSRDDATGVAAVSSAAAETEPAAAPGVPADHHDPGQPAPRRWWRTIPAWSLVACGAIVGLLVGLIVPALMAPQTVAQLRPASVGDAAFPFDWYVVDRDTLVKYENYGDVEVWTATNEQGIPCLFVSVGQEWLSTGCAPGELDPTVDLNIFDGMPAATILDLPTGSVLRFILRGDVVGVWLAEVAEPAPTP